MKKQILVVLRKWETPDQMMPYLGQVAEPGMRVVFMMPYPLEGWPYLRDDWIEADTARGALSASNKVLGDYSWDRQKAMAEQKIASLRATFERSRIEVRVDLYTGSLNRIVREHERDRRIHLIVTLAQSRGGITGLFARCMTSLRGCRQCPYLRVFCPGLYPIPSGEF
jgi:hypothetical protein